MLVQVYKFTTWSHPPKWNIVLIIIAFIMCVGVNRLAVDVPISMLVCRSVVWIMFIASELVTVLAALVSRAGAPCFSCKHWSGRDA